MIEFTRATEADLPALMDLMPQYYELDHLPYDAARAERALREVIATPGLGELWMIRDSADWRVLGYMALLISYSLEFGGRVAFVDELFVHGDHRGKGIGTRALEHAARRCAQLGMRNLRLEVTQDNGRALKLYRSLGFEDLPRHLLSMPIGD